MLKYLVLGSCIFMGVALPISLHQSNSTLNAHFIIAFANASIAVFSWGGMIAFKEMKNCECEHRSKSYLEKRKRKYGSKYK